MPGAARSIDGCENVRKLSPALFGYRLRYRSRPTSIEHFGTVHCQSVNDAFPLVAAGSRTQHERVAILQERCVSSAVNEFSLWKHTVQ